MSCITAHESCKLVDQQLPLSARARRLWRPTVVGAIVVPATAQIVLVQPKKAAEGRRRQSRELSLKIPQGGIKPGETAADACMRDVICEELRIDPEAISALHGLPSPNVLIGGQRRDWRLKVYGLICGIAPEAPALDPNPDEIAYAGLYNWEVAEEIFATQAANPETADRGKCSLALLSLIADSGLVQPPALM